MRSINDIKIKLPIFCSLRSFPIFVLTIFINFFLAAKTSFSPVYFAFLFSCFFLLVIFSFSPNICVFKDYSKDKTVYIFFSLFCIHFLINSAINQVSIKTIFSVFFSFLCFFIGALISSVQKKNLNKILIFLRFVTTLILLCEFIYRFSNSTSKHSYFYIYDYKSNSFMFPDTNAVGVCIEFYICFLLYIKENKIQKISIIEILILVLLLILTFSRAALFGVAILILYYYIFRRFPLIVKFFSIVIVLFFAIYVYQMLLKDGSFVTKIDLFIQTMEYTKEIDFFHFFLGNGIDSSVNFLTRYGHNYLTLFLIELGLNGLILYFSFFAFLVYKTRSALFVVLPYLVTGLSYMPFVIPFFYLYLSFIYNFEIKKRYLEKHKMKEKSYE